MQCKFLFDAQHLEGPGTCIPKKFFLHFRYCGVSSDCLKIASYTHTHTHMHTQRCIIRSLLEPLRLNLYQQLDGDGSIRVF